VYSFFFLFVGFGFLLNIYSNAWDVREIWEIGLNDLRYIYSGLAAVGGSLVDHQCVWFHGGCRVVECVRVLSGFALQLTLIGQGASTAVAKEAARYIKKIYYLFHVSAGW